MSVAIEYAYSQGTSAHAGVMPALWTALGRAAVKSAIVPAYANMTSPSLAQQITGIVKELNIDAALKNLKAKLIKGKELLFKCS